MKTRTIHRLPSYDSHTSRAERIAFSCLGMAGAALITAAVFNAYKFTEGSDTIVTALSAPGSTNSQLVARHHDNNFTNLLRARSNPHQGGEVLIHTTPACAPHGQPL